MFIEEEIRTIYKLVTNLQRPRRNNDLNNCEAQARVRQGKARMAKGERPQSLNPCLELTLKLVANTKVGKHDRASPQSKANL